ncbi:DUF6274 family protein [Streptomyces sp. Z26]|uniref:DUF6274 family protein n=1 Tax=Streptomyces sp. Z26 TaxID=2500177 RepID=UPI000EF16675|nr:DUF6274 family protein [Streptomyces sp. Z26]RLL70439.1 hypothetical protein D7M15_13205 [Streptomyces sp. Z26]
MADPAARPRHHQTRALLRAHLSAASAYRHAIRHCPVCLRLLRLALESGPERGPEQAPGPEARPERR